MRPFIYFSILFNILLLNQVHCIIEYSNKTQPVTEWEEQCLLHCLVHNPTENCDDFRSIRVPATFSDCIDLVFKESTVDQLGIPCFYWNHCRVLRHPVPKFGGNPKLVNVQNINSTTSKIAPNEFVLNQPSWKLIVSRKVLFSDNFWEVVDILTSNSSSQEQAIYLALHPCEPSIVRALLISEFQVNKAAVYESKPVSVSTMLRHDDLTLSLLSSIYKPELRKIESKYALTGPSGILSDMLKPIIVVQPIEDCIPMPIDDLRQFVSINYTRNIKQHDEISNIEGWVFTINFNTNVTLGCSIAVMVFVELPCFGKAQYISKPQFDCKNIYNYECRSEHHEKADDMLCYETIDLISYTWLPSNGTVEMTVAWPRVHQVLAGKSGPLPKHYTIYYSGDVWKSKMFGTSMVDLESVLPPGVFAGIRNAGDFPAAGDQVNSPNQLVKAGNFPGRLRADPSFSLSEDNRRSMRKARNTLSDGFPYKVWRLNQTSPTFHRVTVPGDQLMLKLNISPGKTYGIIVCARSKDEESDDFYDPTVYQTNEDSWSVFAFYCNCTDSATTCSDGLQCNSTNDTNIAVPSVTSDVTVPTIPPAQVQLGMFGGAKLRNVSANLWTIDEFDNKLPSTDDNVTVSITQDSRVSTVWFNSSWLSEKNQNSSLSRLNALISLENSPNLCSKISVNPLDKYYRCCAVVRLMSPIILEDLKATAAAVTFPEAVHQYGCTFTADVTFWNFLEVEHMWVWSRRKYIEIKFESSSSEFIIEEPDHGSNETEEVKKSTANTETEHPSSTSNKSKGMDRTTKIALSVALPLSMLLILGSISVLLYFYRHEVQRNLRKGSSKKTQGLCGHRTTDNAFNYERPLVVAYYNVDYVKDPKGTNYWRNRILKVAKKFEESKTKVKFAISNKDDFSQEVEENGLGERKDEAKPLIAGLNDDGKFPMEAEFSMDALEEFVNDFLGGKIEAYMKSEPVLDNSENDVKIVVARNFKEIVDDEDKDVLIEFYAPWCGHCKKLAPIFDELGEKLAEEDIVIAKMDATANDVPPKYKVQGFPTIFWVPKGKKDEPENYNGGRELDDFVKYIAKHSTKPLKGFSREGKKSKKVEL